MGVISYYKGKSKPFYFLKSTGNMKIMDREGIDEQVASITQDQFDNLQIDGKKATFGAIDGDNYDFNSLPNYIQVLIILSPQASISKDDTDLNFLLSGDSEAFVKKGMNTDDEDYSVVIHSSLLTGIQKTFEQMSSEIESSKEVTPSQFKFYSRYSSFPSIRSLPVTSDIRILIVKYTGESAFIKDQFPGLEDFFDLEGFQQRVDQEIRKRIDEGIARASSYPLFTGGAVEENNLITIEERNVYGGGQGPIPVVLWPLSGKKRVVLAKLHESPQKKLETAVGKKLLDIAGYKPSSASSIQSKNMRTHIPYEEIKYLDKDKTTETALYESPSTFDKITLFKRPNDSVDFYPEFLKRYYDPTLEISYVFWRSKLTTGPMQVVMGQYIKFVDIFRDEDKFIDKATGEFKEDMGTFEKRVVDEAVMVIIPKLFAFQENLIRYNLAEIVEKEELEDLKEKDPDKALADAKQKADDDLQGLKAETKDDELDDELIEQRIKLYKQCCLLLNMHNLNQDFEISLNDKKKENHEMHSNNLYNNRFYMVSDTSDELSVKNKLITPSGEKIKPFMNITNDILSALRPRLRLYKIYKDSADNKIYSFEFPFPTYTQTDRAEVFNGKDIDRGDGLGIKSFNFSFDGETPATSQKYIKADLTLFFQSFQDFIKERTSKDGKIGNDGETEDEKFRYVDLFVNTKHCPRDPSLASPLHYDPEFYRLRVDVGWEPRTDAEFIEILKNRGLDQKSFNAALEVMNKSFYLNLVDHEIDISDTGTVTISANYIAFIEGLLDNNNALLSRESSKLLRDAVLKYEQALKTCRDDYELAQLRATINAIRIGSRNIMHQSLIEKLLNNDCLYYSHVEGKDRRRFAKDDFFRKTPDLVSAAKVVTRADKGMPKKKAIPNGKSKEKKWNNILQTYVRDNQQDNNERITFFFMSDMVYFLLDSLYEEDHGHKREEQIKIILSSFSLDIPYTSGPTSINIGQIPVEVETFTKWYKEEIIDKELESISFMDFIKRFVLYLITDIFSEICINSQQHKRMSFMTAPINSVKRGSNGVMENLLAKSTDPIIDVAEPYTKGKLPLPTGVDGNKNPTNFVQYLLIYPHYRPDTHLGRGNALKDANRGVHHLYIGADRGLLKNATFSKSDIQYIREARMMSQGQNSLLQLSSLYRCDLKMVGNTIFYPGMLLYLNPFGFGGLDFGMPYERTQDPDEPKLANIMGIGGYQKVITVSSTIDESGKFETNVECIFEHTGEVPDPSSDSKSIRQRGKAQQRIPNICSDSLDKVDKADCKIAKDTSRKLQQQIRNMATEGTIDSSALEPKDKKTNE